jgi:hypothetical protein
MATAFGTFSYHPGHCYVGFQVNQALHSAVQLLLGHRKPD